jgi:IS30 family transposase
MPGARLSLEEREEIALGIASGRSLTGVARGLGGPVSTVAREVAPNGGRPRYRAVVVERATRRPACRPKARRLATDRELAREVERRLRLRHSPERPANRLRLEHLERALVGVS